MSPDVSLSNFKFNITVENRFDSSNKLVFAIVNVEIKTENLAHTLGSVSVSCFYHMSNYDDIIEVKEKISSLPPLLRETINSVSISTTRGVMFSIFKGTILHNALLPVVDPKQFNEMHK